MALNFQAFIDESVTPGDGEFVLAGHIATAESWTKFSEEWERLLSLGILSEVGTYHFKMSEMALSTERMERVPAFYRLIEEHVVSSISCRLNQGDFARAKERVESFAMQLGWTPNWNLWGNPYYVCFRLLVDNFHARREDFKSKLALSQKVDFIFDDKTEKKPILEAWDEILGGQDEPIRAHYGAIPRFENDQEYLPLQAADLWAWWVREWYEEDAHEFPDRMRDYDFGAWRGKQRPQIVISANEDQLVLLLRGLLVETYADGYIIQSTVT